MRVCAMSGASEHEGTRTQRGARTNAGQVVARDAARSPVEWATWIWATWI